METKLAIKVYKYILIKINGWSKSNVDDLTYNDYECDPIFKGLLDME